MKKYLDTSQLITYQSGNNKGHYDWKNNIGKELYFEYDDISGIIKILDSRQKSYCNQLVKLLDHKVKLHCSIMII